MVFCAVVIFYTLFASFVQCSSIITKSMIRMPNGSFYGFSRPGSQLPKPEMLESRPSDSELQAVHPLKPEEERNTTIKHSVLDNNTSFENLLAEHFIQLNSSNTISNSTTTISENRGPNMKERKHKNVSENRLENFKEPEGNLNTTISPKELSSKYWLQYSNFSNEFFNKWNIPDKNKENAKSKVHKRYPESSMLEILHSIFSCFWTSELFSCVQDSFGGAQFENFSLFQLMMSPRLPRFQLEDDKEDGFTNRNDDFENSVMEEGEGAITSDVLNLVCLARKRILGPFSPSFNVQDVLAEGLRKNLPEDAHLKVSGKLHISLTKLPGFKNVIVSKFYSKEDLIQALLASAFVPFFSGSHPPKFHGAYYMDGGFSNNLVTLDENTITVSPFCGETDICPRDTSSQLFHVNLANTSIEVSKQNIYRFARILYPPNPEVLTKMCMQGFHDALRFLQSNNLIKCARYIAVESTFLISAKYEDEDEEEHDPECQDCLRQREEAQSATLDESVRQVFQEATEATRKGLMNWLYQWRGVKLLSVLMLPYTLPLEIAYAAVHKLLMPTSFLTLCEFIMDQLEHFLHIKSEPNIDCVACTCQLTDTQYCGRYSKESVPDTTLHAKSNIGFPVMLEDAEMDKSRTIVDGLSIHRPSLALNKCEIIADDTFENILEVTAHHEALMTFYYMDDNDKMKVTEIFEVTEAEAKKLAENKESKVDLVGWLEDQEEQINAGVTEEKYREELHLFSDPESDWTDPSDDNTDLRPESDQRTKRTRKS